MRGRIIEKPVFPVKESATDDRKTGSTIHVLTVQTHFSRAKKRGNTGTVSFRGLPPAIQRNRCEATLVDENPLLHVQKLVGVQNDVAQISQSSLLW
jgi:hypothetical protein